MSINEGKLSAETGSGSEELREIEEVLERYTGGYHRCYLSNPIHLDYCSDGFLEMIGYSRDEISELFNDKYSGMIHPEDVESFRNFIYRLAEKEQSISISYRMVKKDGGIIYVNDMMTSKHDADGIMWGFSVVMLKTENDARNGITKAINEVISCGIMHVSCERASSVKYMNPQMVDILRCTGGHEHRTPMVGADASLIIPPDETDQYVGIFRQAYNTGDSINFNQNIICCDGMKRPIMGWVRLLHDETGDKFFQVFMIEMGIYSKEEYHKKADKLLMSIAEIYDVVIEFDLNSMLARFIKDRKYGSEKKLKNLRISLEDAVNFYLDKLVAKEDREKVSEFFRKVIDGQLEMPDGSNPKVYFDFIPPEGGALKKYVGFIVRLDDVFALFCCHDITDPGKSVLSGLENRHSDEQAAEPEYGGLEFPESKNVYIRTFGHFDVFVDGKTMFFRNEKAKELMALLVDRRGGYISAADAIGYLWEEEPADNKRHARYRKVAMRLKNTLEEYGIEDILISRGGKRCIDTSKIHCDLLEYLSGDEDYAGLFKGLYMLDYSWGEVTLSELSSRK